MINRKTCINILNICRSKLGPSKYHKQKPKLICYTNPKYHNPKDPHKGYFNPITNTIHIYLNHHSTTLQLCNTIIHEYKHHQQHLNNYHKYSYNKNPYEISANKTATKYQHSFNKILKTLKA